MADVKSVADKDLAPAKQEEEGGQPKQEVTATKPVSYHKLFRFADGLDLALFVVGLLMAAGQGFCQVFMIVLFGDIMDELMLQNSDATMEMVRYFCYLGVACFVTGWLMFSCTNASAERQKMKLRLAYLRAVIHQDVSWFDTNTPATLPERISSNIEKISLGMGDKAGNFVMDVSMLVCGFVFAFYYWWKLTLIILAIVPLMAVGAGIMGKAMADLQGENQTWYGAAGACAEETMRALRTVISFRAEELECSRYGGYLAQARRGGVIAQTKVGIGMGYMMAVMFGAYGVAFWCGALLIRDGELQPSGEPYMAGDVMKVFFCVMFGGFALGMMGEPGQALASACAAGAHLYEVLDSEPAIESPGGAGQAAGGVASIESVAFEDVHFAYPARPDVKVLDGATLAIRAGQKVALVGESGSGKSTIISLIERFYDPAAGRVLVNGADVRALSPRALRAAIGYVGQEPVLFATSILSNIMHGNPDATKAELEEVQRQAQLGFVGSLERGLETFVGTGGSQFSGGQKQRIALARALIKKPSLLLLDEATSALDNKSEKMVQETLDHLGRDSSRALTTIEVAHRLSTVRNRDVIFVMQRGRVAEQGSHEELMALRGVYYSLVAAQGGVDRPGRPSQGGDVVGVESLGPHEAVAIDVASSSGNSGSEEKVAVKAEVVDADALEEKRKARVLKTYRAPLGRIMAFCRPEWIYVLPGMVGAILNGAKEPLLGFVIFETLEKFYNDDLDAMYRDVVGDCWYFVAIGGASWLGSVLQFGSFGEMKEGLTLRMRSATMKHLLRMEVGYHDDPDHTPSRNVFALEMYAFRAGNLMTAIGAYANVAGALAVGVALGFATSWRMSLVMLGMIPVIAASQYFAMVMMMAGQAGTSEELKTAQQVISDALNSIRTVRALGAEDTLTALVAQWSLLPLSRGVRKALIGGFNFGLSQAMVFFIFAFAFWWAMWLIENGYDGFKEAMQAQGCILFGAMGMGQAMSIVGNMSQAKLACHDLFRLLDRKSLIDGVEPTGETPEGAVEEVGRIEFRDVRFFYPFRQDVQVLKGVSFTIQAGQSVGLCGPSGGGKSTLLALLQRFYDPQEGQILITGRQLPLSSVDIAWWRAQMGYIGQEPILFDTTVRENVLYGMDAGQVSEEHLERCGRMACLGFLKEQDGWETQVGPRGERLSGGQKQRVAICRAIVREPQIMLLDEATSALDSASEQAVQEALNNVLVGRTSFTIAHRLSTIERSDVILVCAEGLIVEAGAHGELMARNGVYTKLQNASHA